MSERMKRRLPAIAAIAALAALTGFILANRKHSQAKVDTGETRRTVGAAAAELKALRPSSVDDPLVRQGLERLRHSRYVWWVWLIRSDGQIVFSNAAFANSGSVEELALEETRRVLSEMPENFLSRRQQIALLAASAIQREGEHNDILRQMIWPLLGRDDHELGFIGVAYEANASLGAFPGYGYAAAVLMIPLGLMVYWLALVWWVFLDAKVRGERAWVWAMFVLLGNLAALFAYLLARQPHPRCREGIATDSSVASG
jgi:hypothetical protein